MGVIVIVDDVMVNLKQLRRLLRDILKELPLSPKPSADPSADWKIELVLVKGSKDANPAENEDGITVVDAKTAATVIAGKAADLIISDFTMPGINGAEMAVQISAALKAKGKTVPPISLWTAETPHAENDTKAVEALNERLQTHLFSECVLGKSQDKDRWKSILGRWLPATGNANTNKLAALTSPSSASHTTADSKTPSPLPSAPFLPPRALSPSSSSSSAVTSASATALSTPTGSATLLIRNRNFPPPVLASTRRLPASYQKDKPIKTEPLRGRSLMSCAREVASSVSCGLPSRHLPAFVK